ncbi:lipid A biosynthesis acyltransferase [Panacibacter sp. DH6]|uniref:Lipid A biosynthesis acyltransferase n=1 Tax=Panacibacter microcysteis TaxID=2793269 RepID=A0A931E660_9BACT|nr:lipid A biosynthesis acyltransferase [Panacibacter microcysteis]MBG9376206.1 lipid A biosynthesis acyltransferase [Panacibacter microcysteis]
MYYVVYGIFYLLSLLPWRVIYIISDGIYGLLYYIIRYRRDVVDNNLLIAFPEKSEQERKKIAKDFYKGFVDNFIEVIKFVSISKAEVQKRFTFDAHVINDLYPTGRNIQLTLGHFFNWEFANIAYASKITYPIVLVYMPIENKVFDRLFKKIRERFGTNLVAATRFRKEFLPYAKQRYALGLVADQNPGGPDIAYWTDFFGRKTAFVKGPERNAKMNNEIVILVNFYKVKRGYYHSVFEVITTEPRTLPEGAITKQMVAFIEKCIRQRPANYLWSHRRWKWEFDDEKHGQFVI